MDPAFLATLVLALLAMGATIALVKQWKRRRDAQQDLALDFTPGSPALFVPKIEPRRTTGIGLANPMATAVRLCVRVLADGKTVAILVSGLSPSVVERLGQHLQAIVSGRGATLQRRDLRDPAHTSVELAGFTDAWLLTDGPPEQLVAVIGEMIGFSLPDAAG